MRSCPDERRSAPVSLCWRDIGHSFAFVHRIIVTPEYHRVHHSIGVVGSRCPAGPNQNHISSIIGKDILLTENARSNAAVPGTSKSRGNTLGFHPAERGSGHLVNSVRESSA